MGLFNPMIPFYSAQILMWELLDDKNREKHKFVVFIFSAISCFGSALGYAVTSLGDADNLAHIFAFFGLLKY